MIKIDKFIIFGLICSLLSIMPGVKAKKGHEPRFKLFSNHVRVRDTDSCNNKCYHIHHWIWIGVLLLLSAILSGLYTNVTNFLKGLWVGCFILEFFLYEDMFKIKQKCFPNCKITKK